MPYRFIRCLRLLLLPLLLMLAFHALAGQAQNANPSPAEETQPETSYEVRNLQLGPGKGTKYKDPNIYTLSPEFARRFKMPQEWVSTELKGADALAYRIVPDYVECGWGGDPKACNKNAVRCEMDVYFDNRRHPLPWDERFPRTAPDRFQNSSHFIFYERGKLPTRPDSGSDYMTETSPFVHPLTGKGLAWQYTYANGKIGGWGLGLLSYERDIYKNITQITFGNSCYGLPHSHLILVSEFPKSIDDFAVFLKIEIPPSFQARMNEAYKEHREAQALFFRAEGEKAQRAIRVESNKSGDGK